MPRYEKTKRYLSQLRFLDHAIKNRTRDMEQIRETLTSISIELKSDRIQTSGSNDKLGDSIAKLVDLERETSELIESYTRKKYLINTQLESLSKPEYYSVLYLRYFDDMRLSAIGKELGYQEDTIKKFHSMALKEFENKFSSTY